MARVLQITKDYEKLVPFFIENELEFSEDEPVPTDVVKCWQIIEEEDPQERLIGAAVLARREGEFIIDGIAVDPSFRKEQWGNVMLEAIIEEVKGRRGTAIYLVARAPGFFYKKGFVSVKKEEAPYFFECLTCPQLEKSCRPQVMKLEVIG